MREPSAPDPARRVSGVDSLRGIAAFSVVWFHATYLNTLLPDGALKSSGHFGWLGVEVFFVISGFIIPYSMHAAGYAISHYPSFLAKRITRLDPPYLLSIALTLALTFLVNLKPGYTGEPFRIDPLGLILHLGYLNAFLGREWVNPIYWTLAIEFQYYLIVGLAFPLMSSGRRSVRLAFFGSAIMLSLCIRSGNMIFVYAPIFLIGVALFEFHAKIVKGNEAIMLIGACALAAALSLDIRYSAAGLLAVAAIRFLRLDYAPLKFLGLVSYSLYLIHVPLAKPIWRAAGSLGVNPYVALAAVVAASLAGAWAFYLIIERPAQRWSRRFTYGRARARGNAAAVSGLASDGKAAT
ncbi:MAG: acyltransferase [Acidobacteria bacterium]|nr:acyltransferase [Acidobacteriota bacterium]MCA1641764.1 acyltransferase [Acidobacteriota bacterium]